MKRFHVHVHVDDLTRNVAFYTAMFGAAPVRLERDYAKWMLEDPRLNFAISSRGGAAGVDHLGIQTDTEDELAELKARAAAADLAMLDEGQTTCCYARSEKHWLTDPQGVAWEHYHTLGNIPVFSESGASASGAVPSSTPAAPDAPATADLAPAAPSTASTATSACCAPRAPRGKPIGIPVASAPSAPSGSSCC